MLFKSLHLTWTDETPSLPTGTTVELHSSPSPVSNNGNSTTFPDAVPQTYEYLIVQKCVSHLMESYRSMISRTSIWSKGNSLAVKSWPFKSMRHIQKIGLCSDADRIKVRESDHMSTFPSENPAIKYHILLSMDHSSHRDESGFKADTAFKYTPPMM